MQNNYTTLIANSIGVREFQVKNVLSLLSEGATIPFIARYRKEMTGSLDEVQIAAIKHFYDKLVEIDKRREVILNSINEQGKLTEELQKAIEAATSLTELEDLYLPYRPKRKTRASVAKEKGLEPLANFIYDQQGRGLEEKAEHFINPEKDVNTIEDAISGARDIIAENVSENTVCRQIIRKIYAETSNISSEPVKGKELEGIKYKTYFDWKEPLSKAASHRVLAMFRGENEGFLKINILPDNIEAINLLNSKLIKGNQELSEQVKLAIDDSYKRLLKPSIENEFRKEVKERADIEAIKVFAENLRQLLMAAPLGEKTVLAIDPGFRTGCKIVVLNPQGALLHNDTIFPHPPQNEVPQSVSKLLDLVEKYKVEAIAIGNGTAGRETENLVKRIPFDTDVLKIMVNESGASIYSASEVARREFPDHDVTVRGAVSIGRRLIDPLSELVKIEPKSIGVGQYQHDVDQNMLHDSLSEVVESCVNQVGVELNTASKELLTYISGIGPSLAGNIVEYRNKNGKFKSRFDLMNVSRMGDKAFEQSAGFLRIRNAKNPLDASAVHPESYYVVEKIAQKMNCTVDDLINKAELRKKINPKEFITDTIGLPTLMDIISELEKPGRDPRSKFEILEFDNTIHSIDDVKEGSILNGIVTNITNFGAFVDIGVHQDGLVHVSELADRFVRDPNQVVKLQQKVKVKVIKVEKERNRIFLSIKQAK